jgi:anthranilate synthase component 1
VIELPEITTKPKTIKLSEDVDYYKLFFAIKSNYANCYLFESLVLPKQQDRYYTIGFDPMYVFSGEADRIAVKGQGGETTIKTDNPYNYLKKLLPRIKQTNPYQGGLVGYFSYEVFNYFESSQNLVSHPDFPVFEFGLYLDGLVFDSETSELTYYTYHEDRSDRIVDLIKRLGDFTMPDKVNSIQDLGYSLDKDSYKQVVEDTLEEIRSGNSFQVEVGIKKNYLIAGDKFAIYNHLRQINPSPYMYYLKFGERELFGASPEIVASLTDGKILTTPAAGTIERGETEESDRDNVRQLVNDPKEIAEHRMLVDMHRNDISRIAEEGSVKVDKLMHIMKFKYVQHMVSDIVGEIREDKDAFDLIKSIMPCGVLTGAPKIETIKIINRNEKGPRGPYGGGVGRFSFNGDCIFAMPIRSLFFSGDRGFNQACAGIVFDSDPEKEYAEVVAKLTGMEQSIKRATR